MPRSELSRYGFDVGVVVKKNGENKTCTIKDFGDDDSHVNLKDDEVEDNDDEEEALLQISRVDLVRGWRVHVAEEQESYSNNGEDLQNKYKELLKD